MTFLIAFTTIINKVYINKLRLLEKNLKSNGIMIMNLWNPVVIVMVLAGLYLAWVGRKGFCCLACCGSGECLGTCGCCSKEGSGCCSSDQPASSGGCCGGK